MPVAAILDWQFLDPCTGGDLAGLLCLTFITDFSNQNDHDAPEFAFGKLLDALGPDETNKIEQR